MSEDVTCTRDEGGGGSPTHMSVPQGLARGQTVAVGVSVGHSRFVVSHTLKIASLGVMVDLGVGSGEVGHRSHPNLHLHSPLRARRSHYSPDEALAGRLAPDRRIAAGRVSEAVKSGADMHERGSK